MNAIRSGPVHVLAVVVAALGMATAAWAQDEPANEKIQEAAMLIQSEEFAKAAEILQQCVKEDENAGQAWFLLGYALHMDGKYEPALKAHRRAAEFEESFKPIATYNIACALALMGQPQPALESLREAIELGYDDVDQVQTDSDLYSLHPTTGFAVIIANLSGDEERAKSLAEAQEHIEAGAFDQAADIYRAILEKDPKNDFACYRLGYSLHGAGKLDEAIEYHQKATRFPGTKGIALYNWGCALSLKGEKEAAIEKLQAAVKNGFLRLDAYEGDPDLDNLRDEQAFKDLVAAVQEKSVRPMRSTLKETAESKKSDESDESDEGEDSDEADESDESAEMEEADVELPPFSVGIAMRIEEGEGVIIDQVLPDSAAERDGLKAGDRIVKVGDKEIGDDPLALLTPYLKNGDKISFEVDRDGESVTVEVKPNKRK